MDGPIDIERVVRAAAGIRRSTYSTGRSDVVIKANHPETIR